MHRRKALEIIGGAAGALALSNAQGAPLMSMPRLPAIFLPHGGGPWPFTHRPMFDVAETDALAGYLKALPATIGRPKALLVISAHWEAKLPTVSTHPRPPMLYDYYGFPPETYQVQWPAPGDPALAERVRGLLGAAGIETAADGERGFDHGTFVPLKLSFPDADVPTVQLSLTADLDPARHLAIGRALTPLRDEGVLIVGSGMSFHNMRAFMQRTGGPDAETFDGWLRKAATAAPAERDALLAKWTEAPAARRAHPREEHLLPLMVIAGAGGEDRGRVAFSDTFAGARITAIHYG